MLICDIAFLVVGDGVGSVVFALLCMNRASLLVVVDVVRVRNTLVAVMALGESSLSADEGVGAIVCTC